MGTHRTATPFDGSGEHGLLVSHGFFYGDKSKAFGLGGRTGDPLFANPAASDYSLKPGSSALAAFRPLQCVPADFRGIPFYGRNLQARTRSASGPER